MPCYRQPPTRAFTSLAPALKLSDSSTKKHPRERLAARVRIKIPARLMCHVWRRRRSEEHTSELQSRLHLVCRLLLEKKNKTNKPFALQYNIRQSLLYNEKYR